MADTPATPPNQDELEQATLIEMVTPLPTGAESPPEARVSVGQESSRIRPREGTLTGAELEFLWNTHSYINEYIRFSDSKAGIAITISGALLGLLYSGRVQDLFVKSPVGAWSWVSWFSFTAFFFLVVAVLLGVWAIKPRPWSRQQRALVYWGGIAKFPHPEAFCSEFRRQSDHALIEHLANHVHELSTVCASKYFWVSCSILAGAVGGILGALILIAKSP